MSTEKKKCLKCQLDKEPTKNYYKSFSIWHGDSLLPICKTCLKEHLMNKEDNLHTVKEIMRVLDKPFKSEIWKQAMSSKKDTLGEYFRMINLNGKTDNYDDSDIEKNEISITEDETPIEIDSLELRELTHFFGRGYQNEDYIWLQNEYSDFLNRYECDSKGMELLIKEICLQQLDIKNRRANGEKVDQQLKTLQDLLGSSNLKPVQETGANAVEQESFGTLIKKFEREKPIPEPDKAWKDVDGIGKYIRTFFFGHMARAIGAENKFQEEYDEEINKHTITHDEGDY